MFIQKIFRAGNSNVVAIPKSLVKDLKLENGVKVSIEKKSSSLVITPVKSKVSSQGVDSKFMKMLDDFMTRHEDVLKKLAKR